MIIIKVVCFLEGCCLPSPSEVFVPENLFFCWLKEILGLKGLRGWFSFFWFFSFYFGSGERRNCGKKTENQFFGEKNKWEVSRISGGG
jgi:hypothetical protein